MTTNERILIATDAPSDGSLVRRLLSDEFDNITVSAVSENYLADFEMCKPDVLILAFNTLAKAERYYLGLFRRSTLVHVLPHRTLILCNKDEVKKVYELCKTEQFDDYILFWPMVHDTPRLPMAVVHALRQMKIAKEEGPTVRQLALQAQRLALLEQQLEQYSAMGGVRVNAIRQGLESFQSEVDGMLGGLSGKLLSSGESGGAPSSGLGQVRKEIERFRTQHLPAALNSTLQSFEPLNLWLGSLKEALSPQLDALNDLRKAAMKVQPLVLVIDDDPVQHKLIQTTLAQAKVEVVVASSGAEALRFMRWRIPDLVLMDIDLPHMNGIEVTRLIKHARNLSDLPVIMITGHSERETVVDSLQAGATDFLVKPIDRKSLQYKIRGYLKLPPSEVQQ